jgi:hypothetical protein
VTNGLFTATLDFVPVFAGNATWLAIRARTNGVAKQLCREILRPQRAD